MENSYCKKCLHLPSDDVHKSYHDDRYGFPIHDDNELFCRLVMEINQAGLSWDTILKKEANFRQAYDQFDVATVAAYTELDRARLLSDAGIIRNRLKVNAAIHNAQQILLLQQEYGSFESWLTTHHPLSKAAWVKLFKKTFKFTGGEITGEFLMSSGLLPGAHDEQCPIFAKVARSNPLWMTAEAD